MKTKRRLKKWVKVVLNITGVVAFTILFVCMLNLSVERYEETAKECDAYYGRMCSHYEVEKFGKGVVYR